MALVLFIIVVGYLLVKTGSDKAAGSLAQSSFEKEQAGKKHDHELWMASVTDKQTEIELQDFIYDNTRPFSKKKSDIGTVGWMSPELKERLSDFPSEVLIQCFTEDRLLLAMMAKTGKLPEKVADCGIYCIGDNCTTPGRRAFQGQHQFLMWVDEQLQRHGIEPMLFKKSSEPLQKADLAKDMTAAHNGKYCWWSGRCYV